MAGSSRSPKKALPPQSPARPGGSIWDQPFPEDDPYADDRQDAHRGGNAFDTSAKRSLAPRLTLPSVPIFSRARPETPRREESGRHRTLLDATSRQQAVSAPNPPRYTYTEEAPPAPNGRRRRENTSARPLKGVLAPSAVDTRHDVPRDVDPWRDDAERWRDDVDPWHDGERALVPVPAPQRDLVPNLAAFRPRGAARIRVDTRALARHASSPWSLTRLVLAVAAITAALLTALVASGEPAEPLMGAFGTTNGSHPAIAVASMVKPETQIEQPELYDSYSQFLGWKGAACSAAALSEILTAWSVPNASIGKVIDAMNSGATPNISPFAGLLRTEGFQFAAGKFGYRADLHRPSDNTTLTYNQILYVTNVLGIPVIINVRISYGYYHFFDGGHFLVITGGDSQGVNIVDSSTYYIHYLSKDVLYQMFTNISAIVVPSGFHYTIPKV